MFPQEKWISLHTLPVFLWLVVIMSSVFAQFCLNVCIPVFADKMKYLCCNGNMYALSSSSLEESTFDSPMILVQITDIMYLSKWSIRGNLFVWCDIIPSH